MSTAGRSRRRLAHVAVAGCRHLTTAALRSAPRGSRESAAPRAEGEPAPKNPRFSRPATCRSRCCAAAGRDASSDGNVGDLVSCDNWMNISLRLDLHLARRLFLAAA